MKQVQTNKAGVRFAVMATALIAAIVCASSILKAVDVRVPLPKSSRVTPVQQLNREGVKELKRGHIKKAKARFVKAYLLDPDDPFTLNNLGYIAEVEGDVDRALKFYQLAANTSTQAVIDDASRKGLKGQPVNMAFQSSQGSEYPGNKANFQAMTLLEKGRIFEAETVLKNALRTDSKNPFLLDSLGYVMESEGDLQSALQYYSESANQHSDERVLLTPLKKWRGKSISEIAAHNAEMVQDAVNNGEDIGSQVARLNLRGVSALNHNDRRDAQKFFFDAYKLDPQNAFTLNNMGYIDELNGDRETAEMYYEAARTAREANQRVTYATRADAEGRKVGPLAESNQGAVDSTLKAIQEIKRRTRHPIQLTLRETGAPAPLTQPKQQPPIGVPTPPLPPPKLPDRDVAPQETRPSPPTGASQVQPPVPSLQPPPAGKPQTSPQADK